MDNIVKIAQVDENGFLDINQFADLIDVSRIEYYRLTPLSKENSLLVEFFDKDERPITPGKKRTKMTSRVKRKVQRRKSA